ncbi:hypothetical protein [Hyphobacterium sp.]|jgi:hypothetical protein|uniref:hypothetical protein n=1 Tax=Hyphobacterium sp. TaxID=2004662 RepID=UPI003BA9E1BF
MNWRLALLLVVAGILTVLLVLRQVIGTDDEGIVRPAPPSQTAVIAQESGDFLPPYAVFDAIEERPLFRPDRRPAAIPEPLQGETTLPPQSGDGEPAFVVVGIGTTETGGVATIRTGLETVRAYVGDRIEGWRIDAINRTSIEVSNGSSSYRLFIGDDEN